MVYEEQGIEGLFNALQCKVTLFDIRSEDEYKKSRARGSINVPNLESIDKIDKLTDGTQRIFVYGDGKQNDENKAKCKKLYELAIKLNAVQFVVMINGYDEFQKKYNCSCVCISGDNQAKDDVYPSVVPDTDFRLYIGGKVDAENEKNTNCLGITHIVRAKGPLDTDDQFDKFKLFHIVVEDKESEKVIGYFDSCADFIENALKENDTNKVLVHCGGGKSRATTFTIAYLMKYRKQSLAFAYGTVFNSRPITLPNDGFLSDLAKYETDKDKLNRKSTKQFIEKSKLRDKKRREQVLKSWGIGK